MDGIAAANALRLCHDLPVVFLTTHADDGTVGQAIESNPFGYFLKPFESKERYTTVEITLLCHRMEREQMIDKLQDALAKVKTLSGLLPICASCKRIRDDQKYWHKVEAYVLDCSDARFTVFARSA